jgi:hypothetical protein
MHVIDQLTILIAHVIDQFTIIIDFWFFCFVSPPPPPPPFPPKVYATDLAGIMGAQAVLAWLDGPVVDDGTAVEIGIFSRLCAQVCPPTGNEKKRKERRNKNKKRCAGLIFGKK